jgi:hypothetical protein
MNENVFCVYDYADADDGFLTAVPCQLLSTPCALACGRRPKRGLRPPYKKRCANVVGIITVLKSTFRPCELRYLPTDLHQIWHGPSGWSLGENDGGSGGSPPIGGTGRGPKVEKSHFSEVFPIFLKNGAR